jgi:hypothetical protein
LNENKKRKAWTFSPIRLVFSHFPELPIPEMVKDLRGTARMFLAETARRRRGAERCMEITK